MRDMNEMLRWGGLMLVLAGIAVVFTRPRDPFDRGWVVAWAVLWVAFGLLALSMSAVVRRAIRR